MPTKRGSRVGAIHYGSSKENTIYIFGYGVYEGDFVPETAVGGLAEAACSVGATNPKIVLDSGKVVWGCECWFGPEEQIRRDCSAYGKVVEVDIDKIRDALRESIAAREADPNDE